MRLILFLCVLMICFSFSTDKEKKQKKGTLSISVEGLKNTGGNIGVLIFNAEEGFPDSKENALIDRKVEVEALSMQIDIEGLPFGRYAIAIVHDENANQELDKNIIGVPKEPFGFSNNKSIYKGLPDFKEASVQLDQDQLKVSIQLVHLFSL